MKRLGLLYGFIAIQAALAIICGYAVLSASVPAGVVARGVTYDGTDYSGEGIPVARDAIAAEQDTRRDGERARFRYGNTEFTFDFSEIGLSSDPAAVASALDVKNSPLYMSNLLSGFLRRYDSELKPRYRADSGAFRQKLDMMKGYIDREPLDADIECAADGSLTRVPAADGLYFDVDGHFDSIFANFTADPFAVYALDAPAGNAAGGNADGKADSSADSKAVGTPPVISTPPYVTDGFLGDVDTLLADIATPIPSYCDAGLLQKTAEALDKVWIPAGGLSDSPFSFLRYVVDEAGLPSDAARREYDVAASALLTALLTAGADYTAFDYDSPGGDGDAGAETESEAGAVGGPGLPGFEPSLIPGDAKAVGSGSARDFQFTNPLPCNIVLFVRVDGERLITRVAGSGRLAGENAAPYEIHSIVEDGGAKLYRDGILVAE